MFNFNFGRQVGNFLCVCPLEKILAMLLFNSIKARNALYYRSHTFIVHTHGTCGVLDCLLFCDQTRPNLRISLVGYHCAMNFLAGYYCSIVAVPHNLWRTRSPTHAHPRYASVLSNIVLRFVDKALDCVESECLMQNVICRPVH